MKRSGPDASYEEQDLRKTIVKHVNLQTQLLVDPKMHPQALDILAGEILTNNWPEFPELHLERFPESDVNKFLENVCVGSKTRFAALCISSSRGKYPQGSMEGQICSKIFETLSKCERISRFKWEQVKLMDFAADSLKMLLRANTLQKLFLEFASWECGLKLFDALEFNTSIKTLKAKMWVRGKIPENLFRGISLNNTITHLQLYVFGFSDKFRQCLLDSLAKNHSVQHLHISNNWVSSFDLDRVEYFLLENDTVHELVGFDHENLKPLLQANEGDLKKIEVFLFF